MMLSTVSPACAGLGGIEFMPKLLLPLVSALEHRQQAGATIVAIVQQLGFENFLYGASASPRLDQESRSYVFTTLSRDWVARYDQQAYIEVDPRLGRALDSGLPLVWDYCSEYGRNTRVNAFLDDSLANGVGSGIVVGLHGPRGVRVVVALSNSCSRIDTLYREAISRHLGEIVLFALYFHELFMKAVIEQGIAPASQGSPLSPRELQCLALAAQG